MPEEPRSDPVPDDSLKNNSSTTGLKPVTKKFEKLPDCGIVERPSALMSQKSCDSDGPKVNRLSSPSPVLGSPSVVMKARSLFDSSDSVTTPELSEKRPQWPTEPSAPQVGSISKLRHSFEKSHDSSIAVTKEEVQKLSSDQMSNQQDHSSKEPEFKP